MDQSPLQATFQKKYDEFIADLRGSFPEIELELAGAAAIKPPLSLQRYYKEVAGKHTEMTPELRCPGIILPGVSLEPSMWGTVSEKTLMKPSFIVQATGAPSPLTIATAGKLVWCWV